MPGQLICLIMIDGLSLSLMSADNISAFRSWSNGGRVFILPTIRNFEFIAHWFNVPTSQEHKLKVRKDMQILRISPKHRESVYDF